MDVCLREIEKNNQKCVENIIILSDNDEPEEDETHQKTKLKFVSKQTSKIFRRSHSKVAKRKVRRLIKKSGKTTLIRSTIPFRKYRYFLDFGNTLVNSRWRWTVIFLTATFVLTWLLFACIWMMISNSNGDLDALHPSEEPCLTGISSFSGFFLFSLETQATIGYGSRYINHYCPEGTFIMVLQIVMGSAICGGMVSIVYVKMARPLRLQCKRLFSSNAVICQRDGVLCLIFRIRDEDNRHIVGTTIDAYIVENKENEPELYSLHLEPPGIFIWPLEVVHLITPESPFWDFSAKDLISKKFEMIVSMQGTSLITGQCSKTRTSYMSTEILWGRRFKPCVHFDTKKRSYYIEHSKFNDTEEVLTPLCSAQRMEEVIMEIQSPKVRPSIFTFDSTLDYNRLNRRRSTVVLTEINKSIELLDDSDSDVEKNDSKILLNQEDNLTNTSLHFNSKERLDLDDTSKQISAYNKARENNNANSEFKPKRKISFGTRVQLISPNNQMMQETSLEDIEDKSNCSSSSISSSNCKFRNDCDEALDNAKLLSNESSVDLPLPCSASCEDAMLPKIPPRRKVNMYTTIPGQSYEYQPYKVDNNIVNYLDEIKNKVSMPSCSTYQRPANNANNRKDAIDIEELIESMEKYVHDNLS